MESLIPNKTLEDLEYIEVLNQCAKFAITQLGKDAIQKLQPSVDTELIEKQLKSVSEFKSSFDNEIQYQTMDLNHFWIFSLY